MALLIMPCHDSCDADDHSITVTIETAQDHHESESDFCSPFVVVPVVPRQFRAWLLLN
ncbi:MAG: hypothetical protein IPG90_18880 [Bacteroidetes bacterium]|nr:hypothetical protein [Bacteroidota bacterium]